MKVEKEKKVHINAYLNESQKKYLDREAKKNSIDFAEALRVIVTLGIEKDKKENVKD